MLEKNLAVSPRPVDKFRGQTWKLSVFMLHTVNRSATGFNYAMSGKVKKRLEMKMKLIQIATLAAVAQRDAEIVVVHLLIVISYF